MVRKTRSDRGKSRLKYAGRPVKRKRKHFGKLIPYVPKRNRGDPIKIWFWIVLPMSREGYHNWNRKIRGNIKPTIYKPFRRVDVPPSVLSTAESIEEMAIDVIGHEGTFLIKTFCKGKNKFGVTNREIARVRIIDTEYGLKAKMYAGKRIFRYWFWRGK